MRISLIFAFAFLLHSCNHYNTNESFNYDQKYRKINISDIIKNKNRYDSIYVEVKGILFNQFEKVCICEEFDTDEKKCIWLKFDKKSVKLLSNLLQKGEKEDDLDEEYILIRGRYDKKTGGHLGKYQGELVEISYIEKF